MACGCGCKSGGCNTARPNGKEVLVLSGMKARSNPATDIFTPATTTLLGGLAVIGLSIFALKRMG